MNLYQDELVTQFNALVSYPNWLVAYSGGVDSTVLLMACQQYIESLKGDQSGEQIAPRLEAIHVDHQFSQHHTQWAEHCRHFCQQREIPLHVVSVDVRNQGGGLEQAARDVRYQAFEEQLQQYSGTTILLLAHHVDDQAETILLRLLRGSGMRGAAAMAKQRTLGDATLVRPLLNVSKYQLLDYAQAQSLQWIEDESNENSQFDRNYLRLKILPELRARWPRAVEALARFSEYAGEAELLNRDLAELDFSNLICPKQKYGECLQLPQILQLPAYRRKNLYRYWMSTRGCKSSDAKKMEALDSWLQTNPAEGQQLVNGYSFRVYRQQLFLINHQWLESFSRFLISSYSWRLPENIDFNGFGELTVQPSNNTKGLAAGDYQLARRNRNQLVTVKGVSKSVHKLMQELEIPAWLRDCYPVVYSGDEVAAVGPLIADQFCAEEGYHLDWVFKSENML